MWRRREDQAAVKIFEALVSAVERRLSSLIWGTLPRLMVSFSRSLLVRLFFYPKSVAGDGVVIMSDGAVAMGDGVLAMANRGSHGHIQAIGGHLSMRWVT